MTRKVVLPGELLSKEDKKIGTGVVKNDEGLFSTHLGLLDEKNNYLRVIPSAGGYNPKEDDFVIGVVSDTQNTYWRLDIASPYSAILPGREYFRELRGGERLKDLTPVGSTVYVKIKEVTKNKGVFVSMKWRGTKVLNEGLLIEVSPSKIPRIIGKSDSMLSTLNNESECDVIAGQNGVVWISGPIERVNLVIEAIRYIEKNTHVGGLTDYIKKMIIEKRNKL